jgi:excisionase family DNA binding protein
VKYTIGQAAKATGRSKSLVSKAIKDGKLSATRVGTTPTSPMEIDASELFRVYPLMPSRENKAEQPKEQPKEQPNHNAIALATALEVVKVERKYQDEKIEDLKGQLQEAKALAEEYRQSLRSSEVKLIGVMEKITEADNKRGFWQRVLGS